MAVLTVMVAAAMVVVPAAINPMVVSMPGVCVYTVEVSVAAAVPSCGTYLGSKPIIAFCSHCRVCSSNQGLHVPDCLLCTCQS